MRALTDPLLRPGTGHRPPSPQPAGPRAAQKCGTPVTSASSRLTRAIFHWTKQCEPSAITVRETDESLSINTPPAHPGVPHDLVRHPLQLKHLNLTSKAGYPSHPLKAQPSKTRAMRPASLDRIAIAQLVHGGLDKLDGRSPPSSDVSAYSAGSGSSSGRGPPGLPTSPSLKPARRSRGALCRECGLVLPSRALLRRHAGAAHGRVRPFPCNVCGAAFLARTHLRAHVATVHERRRPFACPHCGARFGLKWNCKNHVRRVHEQATPFGCARCSKRFAQRWDRDRHERLVHGG